MNGTNRSLEEIARTIREAETIAVCSHVNPDGDTLGCAAAMRLALLSMGKKVSLFCDGKVPDHIMTFLPGADAFRVPEGKEGPFDLMLAVDVSDGKRLGACDTLLAVSARTAQIDHHPTNPFFMEENHVDGSAPAACVIIRELLRVLDIPLTRDLAVCLYTGISTDTGNFAYASTNAECFRIMAELAETGLPLARLNRILFREKSKAQILLLGKGLRNLTYEAGGLLAVMTLTREDFRACNALSEHADQLVNFILDTVGTRMALLARENDDGKIKFSLRAKEPDTICDVAQRFGGGGHPQASGITMDGPLDEAVAKVRDAMIEKLNGKQ